MKIFVFTKKKPTTRARTMERAAPSCEKPDNRNRVRQAGNVFFALFAAVAMVGTIGYGLNTVLRGPITTMTDVTRRTVAESTVVSSSRLAIVGATTQQALADCDNDGYVEPLPFRDPAGAPAPVGGGHLPTDLVLDSLDPWQTEYGYCAWDSGPVTLDPACGATPNRLAGAPDNKRFAIAIISAGKDKIFQTRCVAYDAGDPDARLLITQQGSDDIVLGYTYAEANDLGAGMWKPDPTDPNMAETKNAIEGTGSATFGDAVVLQGNVLTGGGLVLPGDPGDNSLTGDCSLANDRQIRRNTSTTPPSLEICNFNVEAEWVPLSGSSNPDGGGMTGHLVSRWRLDETSGTVAADSLGANNGTTYNGPVWTSDDSADGGSLFFDGTDDYVRVADAPSLRPSAVTVAAWVKRTGTGSAAISNLVTKSWDNNSSAPRISYSLAIQNTPAPRLMFNVGRTTGTGAGALAAGDLAQNEWVHAVGTYDPTLASEQIKLYLNGALDTTATSSDPIAYDGSPLSFGEGGFATPAEFHVGGLDDIRIYNYALSQREIQGIYDATRPDGVRNTVAKRSGRMVTWGPNTNSQLGDGGLAPTNAAAEVPRAVVNGHDFIQASMGPTFGCGLKAGGSVWCWGDDTNGQLGNGTGITGNQHTPTRVENLNNVVHISAGNAFACAVTRDGEGWCWGQGNNGKLGNGNTINAASPVRVSNISDFVSIAAGRESACGIRHNGEGWCWGRGNEGQLGNGANVSSNVPVRVSNISNWTKIVIGIPFFSSNACGLTRDGAAYCWGTESDGHFGNGAASGLQNTPSQVLNSAGTDVWTDWIDIDTTNFLTCGVRANGTGWCWGSDTFGQIGNGGTTTNTRTLPTQVSTYADFKKIAVATGSACGLRTNGDVVCWGSDTDGSLANGPGQLDTDAPVETSLKNVADLAMGDYQGIAILDTGVRPLYANSQDSGRLNVLGSSACALDSDNSAWCWGVGTNGRLGNGGTSQRDIPSIVADTGPWVSLATGSGVSAASQCGIKGNGTMWCWGADTTGVLGNGAGVTADQSSPFKITDDGPWNSASIGTGTACATRADGTAWCWGRIAATNYPAPAQIGSNYTWKFVTSGVNNFCGITSDGTAMCQGSGTSGVLGNGVSSATNHALGPVLEQGPWSSLSMGTSRTCGIKQDGTAWCWGLATNGMLGNALTAGTYARPQLVSDGGPWASISVGASQVTCGIKIDGSLWCWGPATNGMLGNGATAGNASQPVAVSGGPWSSVSVGETSVCGMKPDNSVWCWGADTNGQLGNGPIITGIRSTPYRVSNLPHPNPWMISEDGGGVNLRKGTGLGIGTQRYISGTGAASIGLRLPGAGNASMSSATGLQQMLIESVADNYAAQLSLKVVAATGGGGGGWSPSDLAVAPLIWFDAQTPGSIVHSSGSVTTWTDRANNRTATLDPGSSSPVYSATSFEGGLPGIRFTGQRMVGTLPSAASGNVFAFLVMDWSGIADYYDQAISVSRGGSTWSDSQSMFLGSFDTGRAVVFQNGTPHSAGNWSTTGDILYAGARSAADQFVGGLNGATPSVLGNGSPDLNNQTTHFYIGGDANDNNYHVNGTIGEFLWLGYEPSLDERQRIEGYLAHKWGLAAKLPGAHPYRAAAPTSGGGGGGGGGGAAIRTIGADSNSRTLKFARSLSESTIWLGDMIADMEIDGAGNVGIGTTGTPQARLDVRGAIKIGDDGGGCGATNAGTIKWTGTEWEYCDGSGWEPFGSASGSGGGGGNEWDTRMGSLSLGAYSSCGIKADGSAWCWGWGEYGQLGNNSTGWEVTSPVRVQTDGGATGWNDWEYLGAGSGHTCGLRAEGSAWCWGQNIFGEFGNGGTSDSLLPVRVSTSTGTGQWNDWIKISVGTFARTCGLRAEGSAWCWGQGSYGGIGDGTTNSRSRPRQVRNATDTGAWSDWTQIHAGIAHTCGIRVDGSAWCWGRGYEGQIGNGGAGDRYLPTQVRNDTNTDAWTDWIEITVGGEHTCGIRRDGSAWCWGQGSNGQLGNGGTSGSLLPVRVTTSTGPWSDWIKIASAGGGGHTCGIRVDGSAWCWGVNEDGQLGNNSDADQVYPVAVHADASSTGWNNWSSINTGSGHTCGTLSDGTAWCWGRADRGALGNGEGWPDRWRPRQVLDP